VAITGKHTIIGGDRLLMSTNRERHSGKCIRVSVRRLSEFIDGKVDLLKGDIEGAECDVLLELASAGKLQERTASISRVPS
jgi:FkbM family methyltransferase